MDNELMNNDQVSEEVAEASAGAKTTPIAAKKVSSNSDLSPQSAAKLKKSRMIISIVTLVISLAFIIAGSVLLAEEGGGSSGGSSRSSSTYYDMTIYTGSNSVYFSSSATVCKFTPSSSGYYTFYTNASSTSFDSQATLRDSSGSILKSDDDSGSYYNFSIQSYLYAGNTYYLSVSANGSGYYNLYVSY